MRAPAGKAPMNLSEANKILGGKLVFGDEKQIEAIKFLRQVADAIEAYKNCRYGHDKNSWGVCSCVADFDEEVNEAAALKMAGEKS